MFHGLDVSKPQSIFKYLPILSFTESYVYQVYIGVIIRQPSYLFKSKICVKSVELLKLVLLYVCLEGKD